MWWLSLRPWLSALERRRQWQAPGEAGVRSNQWL